MGACLCDTVPTTISRSDWRGEKRGSAAPKRSVSYGLELTDMNSIAQQAVTNGYGNSENFRAQPHSSSFLVVRYSNAALLDELAARVGKIGIGARATLMLPPHPLGGPPERDASAFGAAVRRSFGHPFQQPRPVDVEQDQHEQRHEDDEGDQHRSGHRLRAERPDEQEHGL